jgi:hypothetical protein
MAIETETRQETMRAEGEPEVGGSSSAPRTRKSTGRPGCSR